MTLVSFCLSPEQSEVMEVNWGRWVHLSFVSTCYIILTEAPINKERKWQKDVQYSYSTHKKKERKKMMQKKYINMHNASLLFKPLKLKPTSITSLFKKTPYLLYLQLCIVSSFILSSGLLFTVTQKVWIKRQLAQWSPCGHRHSLLVFLITIDNQEMAVD